MARMFPLNEGFSHVDADGPDEPAAPAGQRLGEVAVQGLALALSVPGLEVTDQMQ
jgi:hypothetical protein